MDIFLILANGTTTCKGRLSDSFRFAKPFRYRSLPAVSSKIARPDSSVFSMRTVAAGIAARAPSVL